MIQCSVVRCFLTDQAGLRKLGERLLESEVGRISLSENKIGNLCVGKRKIHFTEHVQDDQLIQSKCF